MAVVMDAPVQKCSNFSMFYTLKLVPKLVSPPEGGRRKAPLIRPCMVMSILSMVHDSSYT